jgi:hypothetical protein
MDGQDPRNKGSRGQLMPAASPRVKRVKSGREKKKSKGEREGGEAARAGRLESAIKASTVNQPLLQAVEVRQNQRSSPPLLEEQAGRKTAQLSTGDPPLPSSLLPPFKVSFPSPPCPCWPPRRSICSTPRSEMLSIYRGLHTRRDGNGDRSPMRAAHLRGA